METINIKKENLEAAYRVADESGKKLLEALFGEAAKRRDAPSLDDYRSIKTYEDACEALGEEPVLTEGLSFDTVYSELPKHIIALMKLETISRALWGRDWEPKPDAEGKRYMYYPWFALYTQKEVDNMSKENRGALLSAGAYHGAVAGFGYLSTCGRSSYAYAYFGFRLCQETEEKAEYLGKQFVELWSEYLAFNFTVGERLK